jgi:hypothetical protein
MLLLMLMSLCHCYGYFDPISMENRIWGDGFETVFGGLRQFGACPVDTGTLWLVTIPKSKDRFMERPPMKIIQP